MNIKRLFSILFCAVFVCVLFAGCSDKKDASKDAQIQPTKIGMLSHLNATEQKFNELMKSIDKNNYTTVKLARNYVYFDRITSLVMELESGKIDEASVYSSVANYLIAHNDNIQKANHPGMQLADSFCFGVRKDDTVLKNELSENLKIMKEDGTLDKLIKEYITDLKGNDEPPAVPIPHYGGAEILKVGITGDLPPLDLVLANGKPAGFNTAVLAELSKRLRKNIEVVQIDNAARASALSSKKVDVVFWTTIPVSDSVLPDDIDKPEGMEVTAPYYTDNIVHVQKKK